MNAHSTIIADDLAREIAEIEIIDAAEDHHRGAVGAWFMARPLAATTMARPRGTTAASSLRPSPSPASTL